MIENKKIKLAIGATSLVNPLTGIGQYTLNLAKQLSTDNKFDLDYFYGFYWSKTLKIEDTIATSALKSWIRKNIPYSYKIRRGVQKKAFNSANLKDFDLYHEPNFLPLSYECKTVVTIHDLSYIRHPHAHPIERVRIMNELLPEAIEKSNCIIADSEFTKQEIISEFSLDALKIKVVPLGKSAEFYPRLEIELEDTLTKYGLKFGQYTLTVGTLEPRKNITQVIKAYQNLPHSFAIQFPLVVVGVRGWKESNLLKELDKLISQNKAFVLGFVSDEDLPKLYSGARTFVFPSIYEGFGLPPLEAMASGIPVITSNTSSIPEVVGKSGLMFDIGDVETLSKQIMQVSESNVEFARLSQAGLLQARHFTWKETAQLTSNAYDYALEN